ncbi:hypothetical protein GCM10011584_22160 [Nocardioides phosphati]|uniref:Zinc ribbon domain-containing protein n=1 Tax=Nocardioides phosphati TaxID=1867775 RepID=A0ABQ2NBM9_9ACTN|nr:hypothetical protein [Nocardioides phosphati]GGO90423.1 hypothetical protein GCM10011584_22160 [Nocardioides phosphati]
MVEDRAGDPLVAALWDMVEDWSSAAIQRTREAAATGPTDVLDAEIRLLISHAAQLRGVIDVHLDGAEPEPKAAPVVVLPPAPERTPEPEPEAEEQGEILARLHEVAHAQVCPECFTMVRLDEVETHDLVCVRHKVIEKMERKLEEEQDADPAPASPAAAPVEREAEPEPEPEPEPHDVEPEPEPDPEEAQDVEAGQAEAPVQPSEPAPADHTCNSADFERPLCATCGSLHWYCSICGAQRDACREAAPTG